MAIAFHSSRHIHSSWCIHGCWFTLMVTFIPHGAFMAIGSLSWSHPSLMVHRWLLLHTPVITSNSHGASVGGYCFTLMVTSIPHGALVAIGWLWWPHPSHMVHCWLLVYSSDHIHSSWCISDYWFTLVITSIPHGAFIGGYCWFILVVTSIPHGVLMAIGSH